MSKHIHIHFHDILETPTTPYRGFTIHPSFGRPEREFYIKKNGKQVFEVKFKGPVNLSEVKSKIDEYINQNGGANDRRAPRDKQALIYYRDVPEKEFNKYQIGQSYQFGSYKGKVIGKRRGEISGLPQVLVEWADAGEDLVGQIVRFKTPGPNGLMQKAGTVKRILPDGRFEIKAQQGGYYQFSRSEIQTRSEWT